MFNVYDLSDDKAKEYLLEIINKLDELDLEDFFGSEGWKHYLEFEGGK